MYLLLLTTFLGSAEMLIPGFIQFLLKVVGGESVAEQKIKHEITKMRQQLQTISMVDQFASYAKVQRKINLLNQHYKDKVMERFIGEQNIRLRITGVLWAVVALLCLWVVWEHRSNAVVALPYDLVWPLGPLLAFPSCQVGEISVVVWMGIIRAVCYRISKSIGSTAQKTTNLPPGQTVPQVATGTPVAPPLD
ncbi:guided entry of tail-anchored proteins factor 1-like [Macrobrachium nipponense]|uniref:guided entry of tail-anchored proteins factor 1-like n=1 Tax=Macrobrachium nipponense TaxID=159736 RepID=UPI0030C8A1C0